MSSRRHPLIPQPHRLPHDDPPPGRTRNQRPWNDGL